MSDFISLTCPSCGHAFPVADKAHIGDVVSSAHKYPACGVASILKGFAGNYWLESYAACPKCHRNDMAEKISGLAKAANKSQIDLRPPVEPRWQQFTPSGMWNLISTAPLLVIGCFFYLPFLHLAWILHNLLSPGRLVLAYYA